MTNSYWPPLPLLSALLITLLLVIAPHATRFPAWLTLFAALIFGWRYLAGLGRMRLPGKWFLLLLALAAALGIGVEYRTLFGRDAGVALFTLMVALKLLELRTARDAWLMVFFGYFLVMTHFLYNQNIFFAIYLFVIAWLLTSLLIAFSQPLRQLPWHTQLKFGGTLLMQAVPVMLVLFVLFPRVNGPLWGMPKDAFAGLTGLSDSMSPGAISHLAQSDAVAFRVEYERLLPRNDQRYFRVLVLDRFDGRTWRASPVQALQEPLIPKGDPLRYAITLEPHDKPWLPVMDYPDPSTLPAGAQLNRDFTSTQRDNVQQRKRYTLTSHATFDGPLETDRQELAAATRLPIQGNPRARMFARKMWMETRNEVAYVNKILTHFHNENFVYTLRPALLGTHSVDEFLFDTRRGFCEHYASSFAYLMRAVGIPARVVTGYQGGEFNPLGNYLIVRQADAHAWTEVFLSNRGWVRIDPTAAVAASRIEQGIASALPAGEPLPLFLREPAPWMKQLKLSWDTFNNRWNQWILGYDQERQIGLFASFGFGIISWQDLGIYLLVGIGVVVGLLALLTLGRRHAHQGRVERAYTQFCQRLAKAGIVRVPHEGPLDFAQRAKSLRPDLAQRIQIITRLYVALRYGQDARGEWVGELVKLVARFKPRKPARR